MKIAAFEMNSWLINFKGKMLIYWFCDCWIQK